jgi:hypothetical protein
MRPKVLHLIDRFAALRVGARLLREWDAGVDALIGGYSIAHMEMQQLLQDPELQARPTKAHIALYNGHATPYTTILV